MKKKIVYSAHPHPPFLGRVRLNLKKGGLRGSQFSEGGCQERGGYLFQGMLQFLHKKAKLTSDIFTDKTGFINKNVFLCVLRDKKTIFL